MGNHATITGITTIMGEEGARAFSCIAFGDAFCGVGEAWHCHPSGRPGHHRSADGSVRPLPKKFCVPWLLLVWERRGREQNQKGKLGGQEGYIECRGGERENQKPCPDIQRIKEGNE